MLVLVLVDTTPAELGVNKMSRYPSEGQLKVWICCQNIVPESAAVQIKFMEWEQSIHVAHDRESV